MNSRRIVAWRSVAALLAAAASTLTVAQPSPTRGEVARGVQPDAARARPSIGPANDPATVLASLEGMWRVDVMIRDRGDRVSPIGRAMRAGETPSTLAIARDASGRELPSTPPTPGSEATRGDPALSHGYSHKRWVMGRNILEETIVLPDFGPGMADASASDRPTRAEDNERIGWSRLDPTQVQNTDPASGQTPQRTNAALPAGATQPATQANTGAQPQIDSMDADRMLQSVSFMSFNHADGTFSYVCMDSREGELHHSVGTFDASSDRVVFDAYGHDAGRALNTRASGWNGRFDDATVQRGDRSAGNPDQTMHPINLTRAGDGQAATPAVDHTPRQPDATQTPRGDIPATGQPASPDRWMDKDGPMAPGSWDRVTVVFEILSPNQHRVTVYEADRSESSRNQSSRDTDADGESDPAWSGNSTPPATTIEREQARAANRAQAEADALARTVRDPAPRSAMGTIIYQATYTRLDAAEEARCRKCLERADELTQASVVQHDMR